MPWVYLAVASLCEITWASLLKYYSIRERPLISVIAILVMLLSFVFLANAIRGIPVAVAYGIWTGIGVIGVAGVSVFITREPLTRMQLLFLMLVVIGVVGLHFSARRGTLLEGYPGQGRSATDSHSG